MKKTKSCGCIHKDFLLEMNAKRTGDLTGLKFGKLTVIEKTELRNHEHVVWKCKCDCGNYCYVSSNYLKNGDTSSCGCIRSKGEEKIAEILSKNNIRFEQQKTFDNCRFPETNALAKFDFYLPDYNILIEFDGEQHFYFQKNTNGWNNQSNYEKVIMRDEFKNKWCLENNIPLIRIPYTQYDNIIISDLINFGA